MHAASTHAGINYPVVIIGVFVVCVMLFWVFCEFRWAILDMSRERGQVQVEDTASARTASARSQRAREQRSTERRDSAPQDPYATQAIGEPLGRAAGWAADEAADQYEAAATVGRAPRSGPVPTYADYQREVAAGRREPRGGERRATTPRPRRSSESEDFADTGYRRAA